MTEPLCPYFGSCGGCSYQNIDYSEQLEMKRKQVQDKIDFADIKVFSGQPYQYRNRMDFVFFSEGLGLREKGSFDKFVNIEECPIATPELNSLLSEARSALKDVFYFDVRKRFGAFCYAVIRTPKNDSSVSIVLNHKDKRLERAVSQVKQFAATTSANNVVVTYVPYNRNVSVSEEYEVIKGRDMLCSEYLGKTFFFPVQGFFQVNQNISEMIHRYCRDLIASYDTQNAFLLDLYGGVGSFAILNADQFQSALIIENHQPSAKASEHNISHNSVKNVSAKIMDAKKLKEIELETPLFIILDPPRSGVHPKTIKRLNEISADVILYVSCNPKHLANDLAELTNYQIKSVALFDMFPQTPHMEVVVELKGPGPFSPQKN